MQLLELVVKKKIATALIKARGARKLTDICNEGTKKGISLTYGYLARIESTKCNLDEAIEVAKLVEEITGTKIL